MIAASFAFGTTQTFQTEVDAFKNYPQIVIALKNAYHKFLKEGIAPIAASGQFRRTARRGRPDDHRRRRSGRWRRRRWRRNRDRHHIPGRQQRRQQLAGRLQRHVAAGGSQRGDLGDRRVSRSRTTRMRLRRRSTRSTVSYPTRSGPFFCSAARSRSAGLRQPRPVERAAEADGGGAGGGGGGGGTGGTATGFNANAQLLAAGDFTLYANRISAGVNRSNATDFAAPAFNVPTFRRTFSLPTGTTSTTAGSSDRSPDLYHRSARRCRRQS